MFNYTWILHKCSELISKHPRGERLSSPVFNFSESKWQLVVYPTTNDGYMSAYLRAEVKSQKFANYVLSAKDTDDEILTEFKGSYLINGIISFGCHEFLKHSNQLRQLKDDVLKISVIIYIGPYSSNTVLYSSDAAVLRNLKVLLRNKILTDFIIKIGNFELPVHKTVFAASSSVFLKMFQSDTSENKEGYMMITDISKEIFISLTNFLYKGEIEKLSYDEAKELLYAADKYNMVDLIQICENVLMSELKASNVFDALLFADIHHRKMLKNATLNFMVENRWKFSDELKLQEILEKSPQPLLKEILSRLLSIPPHEAEVGQYIS